VLAPDDRSVLLDLLRPPPDTTLDVAVATTFTLDLEAALVAPLAFAAFDATGPGDPIATLEAVRSIADRLTVFCQAGEMRVPAAASDLFSFLEPVVHQVRRPRAGALFHPKLWLLRFVGEEAEQLRLLVPTRNLTNDASWDAVLRLDGSIAGGARSANRPLAELLRWCTGNVVTPLPPARASEVASLVESVRRADWEHPEGVNELIFHCMGVGGRARPDYRGRRHLVLSPFVNDDGLDVVAPSDDVVLVSRPEQLELLDPEVLADIDCRWVASMAPEEQDGSNSDVDAAARPTLGALGDLHAKVVVTERARRAHLFVGSANATGAAYGGNVEIVVELIGGTKSLGIDTILRDLGPVLEPCQIVGGRDRTETEELQRVLDDLLRDAALVELRLHPTASDDGVFDVRVEAGAALLSAGLEGSATIELLSRPGHALPVPAGAPTVGSFTEVPLADITPFVVLRLTLQGQSITLSGGTVLRGELVGDPPGRLDAVIARQVDSPSKFLRFLFLLLSLAGALPPWLRAALARTDGQTTGPADVRLLEMGVFEAVTRALAVSPAALDDLERLVERLRATDAGRAALPDGFDELWGAVTEARDAVARSR
jgi:hypothetical protein